MAHLLQAEIGNELRKVLQNAIKLQKKRSDSYLSVDTLLLAVLENKDVAEALNESGALPFTNPGDPCELQKLKNINKQPRAL